MPTHEFWAARKRAKLAAHQAALPPEQRIINRTDWDDVVEKKVSVLTRQGRKDAKRAFINFASDPAVGICNTPEEAEAYFRRGGKPFTNKMLRQFVEASALITEGRILDVPAARSISKQVSYLFGAANSAGNPVERDIKKDTFLWINGPLLTKGLIHRTERDKQNALPQDITSFIRKLFDRRFMTTLPTTRDVLLVALFICLHVDCSSRVSELLRPCMSKENLTAYNIEHKQKMFRWSCVEVFAFKDQETGQIFLQARLTFRSIKDLESKGYRTKTIPLRLLPSIHVAEDSLFWLMVLGLIDGVFEGVSSWSDIDRLQPGPNGQLIPIKTSMQEVPVFRAPTGFPSSQDDLIGREQMAAQTMLNHLHRLSRFCGLEHSMLPSVLRRGSAYILALTVTKEERCARMGHTETNIAYWSRYRNTTSTVDFQALRHGIEPVNVAAMSSVYLDADNAQPPDRVSAEGMAEIRRDADLLAILAEQSDVSDELVLKHGSLESARAADPERHQFYMQLRDKYSKKLSRLQDRQFKIEYKAYWEARKGRASDTQAPEQVPTPVAGCSEVDLLLDEQDQEEEADRNIPIDPQLLEEEADAEEALSSLAANLDEGEAAGEYSDAVQNDSLEGNTSSSASGGASDGRSFATREIARHSLIDDVPTYLYDQPPWGATWGEMSTFFVTVFNHLHPADRFYPNQEPLPGTYVCRFCGLDFLTDDAALGKPAWHSHFCEAERLAQDVLDKLEARDTGAVDKCPLSHLKKDGTTLFNCWFKLRGTWKTFRDHINQYHRQGGCAGGRYQCLGHGAPLAFGSLQDFRIHIVTAHNAPTNILNSKRPGGGVAVEELVYLCPFCLLSIPRTEELEETHLATHVNDAVAAITTNGLAGSFTANLWTHPAFCPFCVYDTTRSFVDRFHQFGDFRYFLTHVSGHLTGDEDTMTCPAAVSTPEGLPQCPNSESLDAAGMAAHLKEAHGLEVKVPVKKAKKAAAKDSSAEESDDVQPKKKRKPLAEMDANSRGSRGKK